MHTAWTSVVSILFGLIALGAPVIGIIYKRRLAQKGIGWLTALSLGSCGVSLCIQVYYAAIMVKLEDWSGLMDTMDATVFAATALLLLTIVLNLIFMFTAIGRGGKL